MKRLAAFTCVLFLLVSCVGQGQSTPGADLATRARSVSVARGGDANTVNATGGARFIQRSGASFREILDLADWDNSVAINVPGQSGQLQSPHYADLLPLWTEGKYFPLLFSREKIEKHTSERLLLVPKAASQTATNQ